MGAVNVKRPSEGGEKNSPGNFLGPRGVSWGLATDQDPTHSTQQQTLSLSLLWSRRLLSLENAVTAAIYIAMARRCSPRRDVELTGFWLTRVLKLNP